MDTATAAGSYTQLLAALEAAGLTETLTAPGPFTVFAPSDDAFAALPAGALDALMADPAQLAAVLKYHVVAGGILAANIADGMNAASLEGKPLTFTLKDGAIYVNDAQIVAPDLVTNNGVIHGIDQVLLPPVADEQADGGAQAAAADPTAASVRTLLDAANAAGNFTMLAAAVEAAGLSDTLAGAGPYTILRPQRRSLCQVAGWRAGEPASGPGDAQESAAPPCGVGFADGSATGGTGPGYHSPR